MVWYQFGDFIDNSLNFVDPDPHTVNLDPHHISNQKKKKLVYLYFRSEQDQNPDPYHWFP